MIATEQDISEALSARANYYLMESAGIADAEAQAAAALMAMKSSMAGWMLTQATAGQLIEIWERYRPALDRN